MREVSFSDPTVQALLDACETVVLATINRDGSPLATPMWFSQDDSHIAMVSVDNLTKVKNLRADLRVSVVGESTRPGPTRCVIIQGDAQFMGSAKERSAVGAAWVEKYGERIAERWGGPVVPASRTLWRIVPRRVKVWG